MKKYIKPILIGIAIGIVVLGFGVLSVGCGEQVDTPTNTTYKADYETSKIEWIKNNSNRYERPLYSIWIPQNQFNVGDIGYILFKFNVIDNPHFFLNYELNPDAHDCFMYLNKPDFWNIESDSEQYLQFKIQTDNCFRCQSNNERKIKISFEMWDTKKDKSISISGQNNITFNIYYETIEEALLEDKSLSVFEIGKDFDKYKNKTIRIKDKVDHRKLIERKLIFEEGAGVTKWGLICVFKKDQINKLRDIWPGDHIIVEGVLKRVPTAQPADNIELQDAEFIKKINK